jgi:UV DNA damage repair endonuclease
MYSKMATPALKIYDKMTDYIASMYSVFQLINNKAEAQSDKRMKMISLMVFNYVRKLAKDHMVNLRELAEPETINLIPVFEYITHNNIELYDFAKIGIDDVDTSKNEDLERFVLTHIYYITQTSA